MIIIICDIFTMKDALYVIMKCKWHAWKKLNYCNASHWSLTI